MICRTKVFPERPGLPSLAQQPCPLTRMRPVLHRFQSNAVSSLQFPRSSCSKLLVSRNVILSLSSVPQSLPLCYNRPAVERTVKWEPARVQAKPVQAAAQSAAPLQQGQNPAACTEDPSRYCPVCSQRLESRRCKLICSVCGYYMSCAYYYQPHGVFTSCRSLITIH